MLTLFNANKNRLIEADVQSDVVRLNIGSPAGSFISKQIPTAEWPKYLQEKMDSGYKEIEVKTEKKQSKRHPVIENLARISRQIIEENYIFHITPSKESISEAKNLLLELAKEEDLISFNQTLYKLFELIPRKMKNPILFTAKNTDEFHAVLERENDLLDNLDSYQTGEDESDDLISCRDCTREEEESILKHLDDRTAKSFKRAYAVSNRETDDAFSAYLKKNGIEKTKYLYHGSRNENWYSIIKTGLKVNPVNVIVTGKMFGNGIYFAPNADKSNGYTSLSGSRHANGHENTAYLGVFEVATGDEYITEQWSSKDMDLAEDSFRKIYPGKNSLHAVAGSYLRADEVIVYNNNACRIKYLVELKR